MSAFTHIVSLGYRCRTTRRLRDFFGTSTAFPFDWWITPVEGLVRFLADWDLERLYDPARLAQRRRWGRVICVENRDYGFRLQHDFPMDEPREHVLPGWQAALPEARSRTAHLMAKLDQQDRGDRNILFVREVRPGEEAAPERFAALCAAAQARVPQAQASFLLISETGLEPAGWIPLRIKDPVRRPWSGTPAIWDAALASLDFRFERRPGWGEPALTPPGGSLKVPAP